MILDDSDVEVVLDVSRLVSRAFAAAPTGIDRVELAYARQMLREDPSRTAFRVSHYGGIKGRVSRRQLAEFLDALERHWGAKGGASRAFGLAWTWRMRIWPLIPAATRPRIVLQVSPHHLADGGQVRQSLAQERAKFVVMVHDAIPITHPEYARHEGADVHRARFDTIARHADAVLVNSVATGEAVRRQLAAARRDVPVRVALLGTERFGGQLGRVPAATPAEEPYFLCVGTIEPRKNHLLLLNLWRAIVERGRVPPRLVIVGRRGWENENVVDMLERCPALVGRVEEAGAVPDGDLNRLMAGARAMLMPSFAEGFGMPVAEALAMGTPVIASDLAALREVGQDVPEYLDPLDGEGWRAAIEDYAVSGSARRAAQLARMADWRAPGWDTHFAVVRAAVSEVIYDRHAP